MSDENRSGAAPSAQSQETIADISALLRDLSKSMIRYGMLPTIYGKPIDIYFAELADRIEAANKREISKVVYAYDPTKVVKTKAPDPVAFALEGIKNDPAYKSLCEQPQPKSGNAAKMREALKSIDWVVWNKKRHTREEVEAHRLATEALTLPPRNCDMYTTVKDAAIAFAKVKNSISHPTPDFTFSAWLLDIAIESEVLNGK